MVFLDYRLKMNIEYGADFGPGWKTDVGESASGFEYRDQRFSLPRYSGNIVPGIDSEGDFEDVLNLFMVARGRTNTWRFRDWSDYQVSNMTLNASLNGDESQIQLGKYYTVAGFTFFRPVWRWVESTLAVYLDGEEDTDGTLDPATGVWTFGSVVSPFITPGAVCTITGEFDLEVRFDIDRLPATLATFNLDKVSSIPIREVRRGNG